MSETLSIEKKTAIEKILSEELDCFIRELDGNTRRSLYSHQRSIDAMYRLASRAFEKGTETE